MPRRRRRNVPLQQGRRWSVGGARESPGPTREPALSTRTGRAIVAGAAILSISLPAASAAGAPTSTAPPVSSRSSPAIVVSGPVLERAAAAGVLLGPPVLRPRARAGMGAAPAARPAHRRPVGVQRRAAPVVESAVAERTTARPASRSAHRRTVRRAVHRTVRAVVRRVPAARSGLGAVVAFARAHVGHGYGGSWDCSGFTKRAYAAAGIRLPRTSGAQAGRARSISWSAARPGDLIVGRGHVGIYMGKRGGRPMMIDSGNPRTGVTYRAVYVNSQGLHPERVA